MIRLNLFLLLFSSLVYSQFDVDGQLNFQGNIGLDDDKVLFGGIRYLPELNYELELDSLKSFRVQLAGNISASRFFNIQHNSDQEFDFLFEYQNKQILHLFQYWKRMFL